MRLVCLCGCSPSSVLFITLEILVSALLVFEVLLRMMAFKRVRVQLFFMCLRSVNCHLIAHK